MLSPLYATTVPVKLCKMCDVEISGAAQKKFCSKCRKLRNRVPIRTLRAGHAVPTHEPRRYSSSHGYVRLRWLMEGYYLETYEHRIVDGIVTNAEHVHHLNRRRSDNSTENLQFLTEAEHKVAHRPNWWSEAEALYRSGLSTPQIGRLVGRDASVVFRALRRLQVPLRSHLSIRYRSSR